MLSYFKINDPFRLIVIIILLIVLRLPYYFFNDLTLLSDVKLMSLGEKLAGSIWSYGDFFTEIAPITAYLATFCFMLFGKTAVPFHVISIILISHQAYLINNLVNSNNATKYQSYVPGFLYAMLMCLSPEFYTINPALLSLSFLLIILNYQFNHLEFRVKKDVKILKIGIYTGIVSLIYPEGIIFLITAIIIFLFYTGTTFRRYLLILFGFLVPFVFYAVYFLFFSSLPELTPLYSNIGTKAVSSFSSSNLSLLLPGLFTLFALFNIIFRGRYSNYQSRLIQAMFIWFLFSGWIYYLSHSGFLMVSCILFPPIAFFLSHYFLNLRSAVSSGFIFNLFFLLILTANTSSWINIPYVHDFTKIESLNSKDLSPFAGKKILVLSNEDSLYFGTSHASAFFNWEKTKNLFESPVSYSTIATVYEGLEKDPPEVIYDPDMLFQKFRERIPKYDLFYEYESTRNAWILKN